LKKLVILALVVLSASTASLAAVRMVNPTYVRVKGVITRFDARSVWVKTRLGSTMRVSRIPFSKYDVAVGPRKRVDLYLTKAEAWPDFAELKPR